MQVDGGSDDAPPYLRMEGKGNGNYDREAGVMESMSFSANLIVSRDNVSVTIPVKMTYKLMTEKEIEEEKQRREKLAADRARRTAQQPTRTSPTKPSSSPRITSSSADAFGSSENAGKDIKSLPASARLSRFNPEE